MMSNNKILTVSYGTFSCTLEGFDDSFGTMKAIAEYFRDLAADDRYFGAEPPQPDAEMLTRIAEREISRRVEAREHEGRIVLSASGAQPAVAQPATALAAAELAAQGDAADDTVAQDVLSKVTAAASQDPEALDEVADADTADITPAIAAHNDVAKGNAGDTADSIAVDDTDDAKAESFFATDAGGDSSDGENLVIEAVADEDEDAAQDAQDMVVAEDVTTVPAPAAADSIAAKLQRIRAVVSQSQQEAETDDMFEDEHAEDLDADEAHLDVADMIAEATHTDGADNAADVIAQAAHDIEDATRVDDAVRAVDMDADEDDDDDIASILARFDNPDNDDIADDAVATDMIDAAAKDAHDDLGLDTLAALMAADDGQPETGENGENIFDDSDAPQATEAPRRGRIVKVKRADIEAALANGQLEEVEDEDDVDNVDASTLSDEEEAELLAELAQVEAELPESGADAPDEATIAPAAARVQDDDVSRLMAEADTQMEEPEGSSRRNAFAHLKAAVAAKKADADIGNDSIKDEGAFRSDLASVVKPRRPEAGAVRSERPDGSRPAPLKLVAEQRVDVDAAPKGPVRPRRIEAVQDPEPEVSADGTFADYAADMGAHNLPALLEAAASYLSFVEGRDQFSRPQLMNKVRQVEKDDFSREDGLRSFGQLLRAGKIEKMKGGRFAVTDDIGYRPDHRAAG